MDTPSQKRGQTPVPSRLPLVQAPMAGGPSTPELAAAVSEAGGFGFVAGAYLTPEGLRDTLARTRALTSEPLGVNLFVPSDPGQADEGAISAYAARLAPEADRFGVALGDPRWDDDSYAAKVEVIATSEVHLATFTFGPPTAEVVDRLHRAGTLVGVTVTSRAEAEVAAGLAEAERVVAATREHAAQRMPAYRDRVLAAAREQLRAGAGGGP
jgi:nitronate monooxygenase